MSWRRTLKLLLSSCSFALKACQSLIMHSFPLYLANKLGGLSKPFPDSGPALVSSMGVWNPYPTLSEESDSRHWALAIGTESLAIHLKHMRQMHQHRGGVNQQTAVH